MDRIDRAWCEMIGTSGIHKKLGITAGHVKVLRNHTRKGVKISLDKKVRLLKKTGWQMDASGYTDNDMMALVKFVLQLGQSARQLGPGYILDKYKGRPR